MAAPSNTLRQHVQVCVGQKGIPIGSLIYTRQGRRESTAFAYDASWLASPDGFNVSADLQWTSGHQPHKAATSHDSPFHGALADTAPDAWGRRVIARDHAKRRQKDSTLGALTELDYLLAVDDSARVGALRLKGADGQWHRSVEPGRRTTPPLIALERAFRASHAIERGDETDEDLRYLQGRGTSLGGMRPKCTLVDENGRLAIGKFPSIGDTRSVTRGEVLALKLAQRAGIQVAESRVVQLADIPVALIYRFDRQPDGGRIPYQSAATMLQASRDDERSYLEIAEVIRRHALDPTADLQQLWRRLIFNLLITNVDDHLQNHGFLHATNGHWRLSPAFDINPFPDKDRESKVWLSEEDGPITNTRMLLARCREFALTPEAARKVLDEVRAAVAGWREVALSPEVGLTQKELRGFEGAFLPVV